MPRGGPGGDGAFADGFIGVGDHGLFGDGVDAAEAVAFGAGAGGGIGREGFGVEVGLVGGVFAGAGVEHAEEVGEGGNGAD